MRSYNNWKHDFNLVETDVPYFQGFWEKRVLLLKLDIQKNPSFDQAENDIFSTF